MKPEAPNNHLPSRTQRVYSGFENNVLFRKIDHYLSKPLKIPRIRELDLINPGRKTTINSTGWKVMDEALAAVDAAVAASREKKYVSVVPVPAENDIFLSPDLAPKDVAKARRDVSAIIKRWGFAGRVGVSLSRENTPTTLIGINGHTLQLNPIYDELLTGETVFSAMELVIRESKK